MTARRESSWKNCFEDPPLWGRIRNNKLSPVSLDFKHKVAQNSLSLDPCTTPPWVEEEHNGKALKGTRSEELYELGHDESPFGLVRLLKACAATKDLQKGCKVHAYVWKHNFEGNTYIGNSLVSMYAKCGALAKAHHVLKELPSSNVVSWNSLITGYVQQGQAEEALQCFNDMLCEGHTPNRVTFICLLKACGSMGATAKGEEIHEKIVSMGMLEKDIVLGATLVDMYAKFGALAKAQQVLQESPVLDVVCWSALIAGYVQQGLAEEALKCFDVMLLEGHLPDAITLICVLKACGSIGATAKGEEIHKKIVRMGMLEKDIVLGNTLVDMYAKFGALAKAHQLLKELPMRNVVSWSALISGHDQQGHGEEALKCFDDMLCEKLIPDAVTFICVLKACASIEASEKGKEIHERIFNLGMLENDIVLGNALVDMYAKCGALAKSYNVLKELPMRDVVSWNAIIAGHAQQGQGPEALKCFDDMLHEGHSPNAVTFTCVLKACGSIRAAAKGEEIYDKIVSMGMLEKDIVLCNTLVDMYAKCGALAKAHQVLKALPMRDVVSWSAVIAGYAQQGLGEEALKCFDDMICEGHCPNAVTFIAVFKACGNVGAIVKGEEIHQKIVNMNLLEKNVVIGNALVDMHVKCSALAKAHQVLKELPMRNVVSWTAVIAKHVEEGQGEEALKCFDSMLHEGHSPNAVTFTCVLKACGSLGAAVKGKEIHDKFVNLGMLEKDIVLGNTLLDMYVKCGALAKAQQVLEELPIHDVVCWNALISGYAYQGQSVDAINCFEWMQSNGVKPDSISLAIVLNACSHSGLLDQAETYFSAMRLKYGIYPNLVHYCCMIDVFARAGKFNKALSVVAKMPSDKCISSWVVLLGACRKGAEVKIGTLAFEHVLDSNEGNSAVYILMADIYRAAGMQEEVHD